MFVKILRCLPMRYKRNIHALPFKIDRIKAEQLLAESKSFFEKNINMNSIEESYIPFYKTDDINASALYYGEYGRDRTTMIPMPVYNNKTKSTNIVMMPITNTDWYPCSGSHEVTISSNKLKTHIYADFKYNYHIIKELKCMETEEIRDIDINIVMDQVAMRENYAIEKITKYIKKTLDSSTHQRIEQIYKADHVRINHIEYNIGKITTGIYYLPVFICKYTIGDYEYYKIINGYNGKISGVSTYEIKEVAKITGIIGGIAATGVTIFAPPLAIAAFITNCVFVIGCVTAGYINNVYKAKICEVIDNKKVEKNLLYLPTTKEFDATRKQELIKEREMMQEQELIQERETLKEIELQSIKLKILGLSDIGEITKESLLQARDRQLNQWNETNYDGSQSFAIAQINQINKAYEQLIESLNIKSI